MSVTAKLRKKAVEYETQRQFDKALALYVRILEESAPGEEVDVGLHNRVGDLLLRQGNVSEAVKYYEKAVELYTTGGFFNNAIALCNKILRHAPGRHAAYFTLGRISALKGLKIDAKRNFLEYAERMHQLGQEAEALRALKEFAELAPEQTDVRLALAEHLSKTDRKQEAAEQLQALYQRLVGDGSAAGNESRKERENALAETQASGVGDTSARPRDLIFLDLSYDPPEGSEAPTAPFVSRNATPASPSVTPAVAFAPPALDLDTAFPLDDVAAAAASAPALELMDDTGAHRSTELEMLDDAGAPSALDVSEHDADDPLGDDAPHQLLELLEPMGERASDIEMPGALDGLELTSLTANADAHAEPTELETEWITSDSSEPQGSNGLQFLELDAHDAGALEPVEAESAFDLPLLDSSDDTVENHLESGERNELLESEEWHDLTNDAVSDDLADEADTAVDTPALDGLELTFELPVSPDSEAAVDHALDELASNPDDGRLRRRLAEALLEAGQVEDGVRELEHALVELESQGDLEVAAGVADTLVRVRPDAVRFHQRRVELAVRANDGAKLREAYLDLADALSRSGDDTKADAVFRRVLELAPDDQRASSALGVAAPDASAIEHSPAIPTTTQEPEPAAVSAAPSARPSAAAGRDDFVDLATWLDEEEPRTTRMITAEPAPSGDEDADFAVMLRKFKEGVARNVDEEDYESHYDLGIAFREMGLVDDAIGEFQKSLRGRSHRVRAYEALGQCFMDKNTPQVASTILGRALTEPGLDDGQLVGVLYLLGVASEALERYDEARAYYERVLATDIGFRDVAIRLSTIDHVHR